MSKMSKRIDVNEKLNVPSNLFRDGEDLRCPKTKKLFRDPVLLVETGDSFERKWIEEYLGKHNEDPMRKGVELKQEGPKLVPNRGLKKIVEGRRREVVRECCGHLKGFIEMEISAGQRLTPESTKVVKKLIERVKFMEEGDDEKVRFDPEMRKTIIDTFRKLIEFSLRAERNGMKEESDLFFRLSYNELIKSKKLEEAQEMVKSHPNFEKSKIMLSLYLLIGDYLHQKQRPSHSYFVCDAKISHRLVKLLNREVVRNDTFMGIGERNLASYFLNNMFQKHSIESLEMFKKMKGQPCLKTFGFYEMKELCELYFKNKEYEKCLDGMKELFSSYNLYSLGTFFSRLEENFHKLGRSNDSVTLCLGLAKKLRETRRTEEEIKVLERAMKYSGGSNFSIFEKLMEAKMDLKLKQQKEEFEKKLKELEKRMMGGEAEEKEKKKEPQMKKKKKKKQSKKKPAPPAKKWPEAVTLEILLWPEDYF